jgi:hypothetical protein
MRSGATALAEYNNAFRDYRDFLLAPVLSTIKLAGTCFYSIGMD